MQGEITKLAGQMSAFEFNEGKHLTNINPKPASHLFFEGNKKIRPTNNPESASHSAFEQDKKISPISTSALRGDTKDSGVEESLNNINSKPASELFLSKIIKDSYI